VVTTTITDRSRRLTIGTTASELWQQALAQSTAREPEQAGTAWLFTPERGLCRLTCGALGHAFSSFARRHGHGDVTLPRLRHTIATVLFANGQLLLAQQGLGHRDASTTLRQYCHALPLEDQDVPDILAAVYQGPVPAPWLGHQVPTFTGPDRSCPKSGTPLGRSGSGGTARDT